MSEGLHAIQKQLLLSASTNALKILGGVNDIRISFIQRHKYEKELCLWTSQNIDWQFNSTRSTIALRRIATGWTWTLNKISTLDPICFKFMTAQALELEKNIIANRMPILNNLINLDWLNLSLIAFKLKVKELFLTNR